MTQIQNDPRLRTFPDAAAAAARRVATAVAVDEPVVFSYEPGDATCYEIAICRPTRRPASADDRHDGPTVRTRDHVVSIVNFGTSYAFTLDDRSFPLHGGYVGKKLGRGSRADLHTGRVVAEVLNAIADEADRIRSWNEQETR